MTAVATRVLVRNHCEGCDEPFRSPQAELICPDCAKASPVARRQTRERGARNHYQAVTSTIYEKKPAPRLTPDEREALLWMQKGVCAICGHQPKRKPLVLDHNHRTGDVRGLLCSDCNAGLGSLGDHPAILARAFDYLRTRGHYGVFPRLEESLRAKGHEDPEHWRAG